MRPELGVAEWEKKKIPSSSCGHSLKAEYLLAMQMIGVQFSVTALSVVHRGGDSPQSDQANGGMREWLELVDAPGSDPGGVKAPWEFDSPLAHKEIGFCARSGSPLQKHGICAWVRVPGV